MKYQEIECKSAMNPLKRKIPYAWDLNIYRGCEHACQYCYAMYSHDYLQDGNFFDHVYYKKNILEALEKELSSSTWKHEVVNIGGVTDSYQPIEKELCLMPEILKLMIQYKTPIIISTKSDLILRDFDFIKELADITYVNVACTITAMDEEIRQKIEPGGVSSFKRFEVLRKFRETNASIGVHFMPIIPYVTDDDKNIEEIYRLAAEVGADYVLPGTLYLRGKTRPYFMQSIRKWNPYAYDKLVSLYQTGAASKEYKNELYERVNAFRTKYQVSNSYMKPMKEKMGGKKS